MIIGTILNSGNSSSAPEVNSTHDGFSTLIFYSNEDAENWAVLQSGNSQIGGISYYVVCTVINTDTNVKRWWYAGTEYTG